MTFEYGSIVAGSLENKCMCVGTVVGRRVGGFAAVRYHVAFFLSVKLLRASLRTLCHNIMLVLLNWFILRYMQNTPMTDLHTSTTFLNYSPTFEKRVLTL